MALQSRSCSNNRYAKLYPNISLLLLSYNSNKLQQFLLWKPQFQLRLCTPVSVLILYRQCTCRKLFRIVNIYLIWYLGPSQTIANCYVNTGQKIIHNVLHLNFQSITNCGLISHFPVANDFTTTYEEILT